jgi:hypothetical protein
MYSVYFIVEFSLEAKWLNARGRFQGVLILGAGIEGTEYGDKVSKCFCFSKLYVMK